jgi:hypothetical protein
LLQAGQGQEGSLPQAPQQRLLCSGPELLGSGCHVLCSGSGSDLLRSGSGCHVLCSGSDLRCPGSGHLRRSGCRCSGPGC